MPVGTLKFLNSSAKFNSDDKGILYLDDSNNLKFINNSNNSNDVGTIVANVTGNIITSNDFSVNTNKLVVKSTGNVGIGITNPSEKLHVVDDAKIEKTGNTANSSYDHASLYLRQNTTTVGTLNGSFIWFQNSADDVDWVSGTRDNDFKVSRRTGTSWTDPFTINLNGNVGIGTNPGSVLHIAGIRDNNTVLEGIHFGKPSASNTDYGMEGVCGSTAGGFYFDFKKTNTSTNDFDGRFYFYFPSLKFVFTRFCEAPSFNNTSDDRLKINETNIINALSVINKLSCEKYDKIIEFRNKDIPNPETIKEAGFIAQEVKQIQELQDFVYEGDENNPWTVNYNSIFTYAVKAIQELSSKNTELETKNTELETKNTELETKNTELETEVSTLKTQYADLLARVAALEGN